MAPINRDELRRWEDKYPLLAARALNALDGNRRGQYDAEALAALSALEEAEMALDQALKVMLELADGRPMPQTQKRALEALVKARSRRGH